MVVSKYISDYYTLPLYLPQVCICLRIKSKSSLWFETLYDLWPLVISQPHLLCSSHPRLFFSVPKMYHTLNHTLWMYCTFSWGLFPLPRSSISFCRSQLKFQVLRNSLTRDGAPWYSLFSIFIVLFILIVICLTFAFLALMWVLWKPVLFFALSIPST